MSDSDILVSQRARRAWWRSYVWLAGVAAALVLLGLGFGYWRRTQREAQIERELARIRATGEPVTAADLLAMYVKPDPQEDNTEQWERVLVALKDVGEDPAGFGLAFGPDPPPPGEPWQKLERAEAFVDTYAERLRLVHAAAEAGTNVHFMTNAQRVADGEWPFSYVRVHVASLLETATKVRAHRGDLSGAVEAVRDIFAIARTYEAEPSDISYRLRISVEAGAREQIHWLLAAGPVPEGGLRGLQADLRRIDYRPALYRAELADRVSNGRYFEQPTQIDTLRQAFQQMGELVGPGLEELGMPVPRGPTHVDAFLWKRWRWDDWLESLELSRHRVSAARQPWPQALRDAEGIARRANRLQSPFLVMSRVHHRHADGSFHFALGATARLRTTDAAIAVELYRQRHATLPKTLGALVPELLPEVPIDPFDAKPVRYRVSDEGYVIYSLGRDGKDDGGTEERKTGAPDMVLRISRRTTSDE